MYIFSFYLEGDMYMNETNLENDSILESTKNAINEASRDETISNKATTTVKLPSNGLINPNVTQVTLKRMTVLQAKTLYSSLDANYLSALIKGCIVDPVDISLNDIHPNDIIYLAFVLRHISSPKNVVQKVRCEECGKLYDASINIPDLKVNYYDPKGKNFNVDLPDSGDRVHFKILSEGALQNCEKIAQRKQRQESVSQDEANWDLLISKLCYMLESKNDEPFEDFDKKKDYIMSLSAYDFQTFNKAYTDIVDTFGLDRKFISECPSCNTSNEDEALIPPDFFRLV